MKTKISGLIILTLISAASYSQAKQIKPIVQVQDVIQLMNLSNLNWKVGDTLDFNIKMSPLPLKGKMKIFVQMESVEGFILIQDVSLPVLGNQHIEALIDKDTGKTLRLVINGEPQTVPDQNDIKIIKMEEAKITVPAGTFDAIHVVTQDSSKKQGEMWINPTAIPINGMLKSIQTQIKPIKITMELSSFKRGQ